MIKTTSLNFIQDKFSSVECLNIYHKKKIISLTFRTLLHRDVDDTSLVDLTLLLGTQLTVQDLIKLIKDSVEYGTKYGKNSFYTNSESLSVEDLLVIAGEIK